MKGAIIGDIVGSIYEWNNIWTKDFPLFSDDCYFTDDTVMTIAVGHALDIALTKKLTNDEIFQKLVLYMQSYGRKYKGRGYGSNFQVWINNPDPKSYNSWGNGAPMRCSSAGWVAKSIKEAQELGELTALPTHSHPEGIKAAQLTSELIYRAKIGENIQNLRLCSEKNYIIPKINDIRPFKFSESSQETMPAVLACFFESISFEDAIRNAISIGGDSDTIAAIVGSIAEAYYGVPNEIWNRAKVYLDKNLLEIFKKLEENIKSI